MNILRAQSNEQQQRNAEAIAGRSVRPQSERPVPVLSDEEVARICAYHFKAVQEAEARGDTWSAEHHTRAAQMALHQQRAGLYQAWHRCTWQKAWDATKEPTFIN